MSDDQGTDASTESHNVVKGDGHGIVVQAQAVHSMVINQASTPEGICLDVEHSMASIEREPRWLDFALDPFIFTRTAGPHTFPDRRPRAVYDAYVEHYLGLAFIVLEERAALLLEAHEPACVRLKVVNPTSAHFRDVELTARFTEPVRGFHDLLRGSLPTRWPALPSPPAMPGMAGNMLQHVEVMASPSRGYSQCRQRDDSDCSWMDGWSGAELEQGILITFDRFDIRPKGEYWLPYVPLKVPAEAGDRIHGEWSATADNVDGQSRGVIELEVVTSTVDLDELDVPGPPETNGVTFSGLAEVMRVCSPHLFAEWSKPRWR